MADILDLKKVAEFTQRTKTEDLVVDVHVSAGADVIRALPIDVGTASQWLDYYLKLLWKNNDGKGWEENNDILANTNPDNYHQFTPSSTLIDLMMLTDNNNLFARPLPFPRMFIPIKYSFRGASFKGMFAFDFNMDVNDEAGRKLLPPSIATMREGRLVLLETIVEEIVIKKGMMKANDWVYYQAFDRDGRKEVNLEMRPSGYGFREWNSAAKAFANLFFNFIDFLNHPDVEYKVHKHDENVNTKRQARGKPRVPPQLLIRVTGKTLRYLDAVKAMGDRATCSHAYWVRGHFRHLASEFYKNKKGSTIWVAPFIKGDQDLIKKAYEMKWRD